MASTKDDDVDAVSLLPVPNTTSSAVRMKDVAAATSRSRVWRPKTTRKLEVSERVGDAGEIRARHYNEYKVLRHVGNGAFANVYACHRLKKGDKASNKRCFALKVYSKKKLRKQRCLNASGNGFTDRLATVRTEIHILERLYHRNVVLLYEIIDDPSSDLLLLVSEFAEHGPSMSYVESSGRYARGAPAAKCYYEESESRLLFCDVLHALTYLRRMRCCHGDIKPQNIFITRRGTALLGDFGEAIFMPPPISKTAADSRAFVKSGTPDFMSPEKRTCGPSGYDPFESDLWSAGLVLYVWLHCELPFTAPGKEQSDGTIHASFSRSLPTSLSESLRTYLVSLLERKRDRRLRDIETACAHAWIGDALKARIAEGDALRDAAKKRPTVRIVQRGGA